MKDKDLLDYSKQVKNQAQRLLKKNRVIETLNKYGEVIITGSYKFDLMYGPDIDLEVITNNPRENSLKALNEFIEARNFQKYEYGDFEAHPREKRPESFIIVLDQILAGVKWEIEIWFFKQRDPDKIKFEEKLTSLSQEQRKKILELKYQRDQMGRSKHAVSSYEIYRTVLFGE